jgi:hypothetical protein
MNVPPLAGGLTTHTPSTPGVANCASSSVTASVLAFWNTLVEYSFSPTFARDSSTKPEPETVTCWFVAPAVTLSGGAHVTYAGIYEQLLMCRGVRGGTPLGSRHSQPGSTMLRKPSGHHDERGSRLLSRDGER